MKVLEVAKTKDIIEALKTVIDIPEHMMSLTLVLDVENPPIVTVVKYAEESK